MKDDLLNALTLDHGGQGAELTLASGSAYVVPADRPAVWAQMAKGLAARGRTTEQIAEALWIDEATALLLTLT